MEVNDGNELVSYDGRVVTPWDSDYFTDVQRDRNILGGVEFSVEVGSSRLTHGCDQCGEIV